MARWLLTLLPSVLALSMAPAAPALKHKAPASFHPTTLGARWVYLDDGAEYTFVVAKVEETDGAVLIDVAAVKDGREEPCQRMRVSAAGVFRLSIGRTAYLAPECLLKLPHRDGQAWEFDLGRSNGGHSKLTAVRREPVATPAGTFDCIRVERTGGYPATYWFAEGVGMVRVKTDERDRVLKSFTPGKK